MIDVINTDIFYDYFLEVKNFGRNGEIRTHDPLHPIQVRYQTALRPDYPFSIFRISAN